MKNLLHKKFFILILGISVFISCSKKTEDPPPDPPKPNPVLGTWSRWWGVTPDTIVFNSDFTYMYSLSGIKAEGGTYTLSEADSTFILSATSSGGPAVTCKDKPGKYSYSFWYTDAGKLDTMRLKSHSDTCLSRQTNLVGQFGPYKKIK